MGRPLLSRPVAFARALTVAVVALISSLSATAQAGPAPQAAAGVPAFRITAPDGGTSLLLGMIYIGDPRVLQPAMTLIQGARRVVVEAEPDAGTGSLAEFTEHADPAALDALNRTGKVGRARWTAHLTSEDMNLLRQYATCQAQAAGARDRAEGLLDIMLALKPVRAAHTVAQPCPQAPINPRSDLLAARARATGIPVVALESPEETRRQQERLASAVDDAAFVAAIRFTLRPSGRQAVDDYVRAINAGDFDEVTRISRRFSPTPEMAGAVDRYMVRERNAQWLPKLERALRGGGAVVMVGAGNLSGSGGLVDLLRRGGYWVEPVLVPAAPPRR